MPTPSPTTAEGAMYKEVKCMKEREKRGFIRAAHPLNRFWRPGPPSVTVLIAGLASNLMSAYNFGACTRPRTQPTSELYPSINMLPITAFRSTPTTDGLSNTCHTRCALFAN